jgi:hypothetical protein
MSKMKTLSVLFLLTFALAGCRSDGSGQESTDFPCICGTPEAAMKCCLHPLCLSGEGNPENPDCVCGTISIDD